MKQGFNMTIPSELKHPYVTYDPENSTAMSNRHILERLENACGVIWGYHLFTYGWTPEKAKAILRAQPFGGDIPMTPEERLSVWAWWHSDDMPGTMSMRDCVVKIAKA